MNTTDTRAHIDAETLAAWAEHSLPAEASAAVESHLSNCGYCQEVLAAFVRSEPVAGAVVLPFWARRPVQWSAAGLAAAAALVAMIWIGRPPSVPPMVQTADSAAASASPAPSAPAELQLDNATASALRPEAQERRADNQAPVAARQVAQAPKRVEQKAEAAPANRPQAIAAPAPPPPVAAMPPPVPAPTLPAGPPPPVNVTAASPVVGMAGGVAQASARPATMAESVMKDTAAGVIEIVVAPASADMARRFAGSDAGRAGAGAGRGGASLAAAESTAAVRWRIIGGTRIERTADNGVTWIALPIQPALTKPLVAGASTSVFVCWFVGADGVVVLSTDGRTLRRVSLPESVALTGVAAVDGMRATVTAADGRKFSTVDGGLTWK